jgi:hypothetical protein
MLSFVKPSYALNLARFSLVKKTCTFEKSTPSRPAKPPSAFTTEPLGMARENAPFASMAYCASNSTASQSAAAMASASANTCDHKYTVGINQV